MPKKHLGQNFLFDPSILRKIIEAANITPDDVIVEIGPGHGRLTKMLAEVSKRVIAIELDADLYEKLKETFAKYANIELVHGDALKYPYEKLKSFKVVANIPYYITTPIIFKLLEKRKFLKSMTLTIQKEVAQRIVAKPNTSEYGILSIVIQYYGDPKIKFTIPRGAFRPIPKVDSALIHIDILKKPRVKVKNEKLFFKVIKAAFSQRRKMLQNSLKTLSRDIKEILLSADIRPESRPENLSIEDFARLSDKIADKNILYNAENNLPFL